MTNCKHINLVLIPENKPRLRCRHCHLTIKAEELGSDCCPECFASSGRKRYDFEPVASDKAGPIRYRCADCGTIIV